MNTYECFGQTVSEEFLKGCLLEGTRGIVRLWWSFRNQDVRIVRGDGFGYVFDPRTRLWGAQDEIFQREIPSMIYRVRDQHVRYSYKHQNKSTSERHPSANFQNLPDFVGEISQEVEDL
jgi:hypothetical protein